MKYYAVLDTNVLVSAMLKIGSVPFDVVMEALNGDIIPLLNDEIFMEYEEVLSRPKFKFDGKIVKILIDDFKRRAVHVTADAESVKNLVSDENDAVFYAVLMEKRKEEEAYLVTGNMRHFPARPYVVTPREMLAIIR